MHCMCYWLTLYYDWSADCNNVCDVGTCTSVEGVYHCVCPLGQRCTGDCSANNPVDLQNGMQSCQGMYN